MRRNKKPIYSTDGFIGLIIFTLMLIVKGAIIIAKGIDIQNVIPIWDFLMGMFFVLGINGDWSR